MSFYNQHTFSPNERIFAMQMQDINEVRQIHADRVAQLQQDYGKNELQSARKVLKQVVDLFTLRFV